MQLFMFYLGGGAGRSNIELHDIQFVAAQSPEAAWPALRDAWFGDPKRLHIDGWIRVQWVDGHRVELRAWPPAGGPRLYFINVGAYHSDLLAEQHAFGLFVADDAQQAKRRALATLLRGLDQQHRDDVAEVDDCLLVDLLQEWHVHLVPDPAGQPPRPEWQGYLPIPPIP